MISIKKEIAQEIAFQNKHILEHYNSVLDELKQNMSLSTDFIISSKHVKQAFLNKDRELLYSLVKKTYKNIKKYNSYLKIVTFRLNDGSTFLRIHKPDMYGDKLNKKRTIILDTISTSKRKYGFEVGKLKMTYRVVTPIIYNNKQLGVIEVGVEPEYITQRINNLYNLKTALLIKKCSKDVFLDDLHMNKIENFLLARGDKLFQKNLDIINLSKKEQTVTCNGEDYIINTMVNLNNHKNEISAKMLVAFSLSRYEEKLSNILKNNLLFIALSIFILFLILNKGFNSFIKKIESSYKTIIEKDKLMIQQSKMAAMGEMISMIAHQWKQPINIIKMRAELLGYEFDDGTLDKYAIKNFQYDINKQINHTMHTLDEFRSFLKPNKHTCEFRVEDTIKSVLVLIKDELIRYNVETEVIVVNDMTIYAIENEFKHVILNLINNAKDSFIEHDCQDRKITITVDTNTLSIKDNAGGISEEIINKIFEAHVTTKEDSNGTGIGLYMSKQILDKMGAKIEVYNEDDGAVFKIMI